VLIYNKHTRILPKETRITYPEYSPTSNPDLWEKFPGKITPKPKRHPLTKLIGCLIRVVCIDYAKNNMYFIF